MSVIQINTICGKLEITKLEKKKELNKARITETIQECNKNNYIMMSQETEKRKIQRHVHKFHEERTQSLENRTGEITYKTKKL